MIPAALLFTTQEWAYLAWHCGWRPPQLQIRVGLDTAESQLHSGNYRPEKANRLGGFDIGASMYNTKNNTQALAEFDPFRFFEPLFTLRKTYEWASTHPADPFGPWAYGNGRPRQIDLVTITAVIGDDPYDITRSPYWRMHRAGVPTEDLPIPPADVYVSRLPPPPMKFGNTGPNVNALQRILAEDDRWIGPFDSYYGPRVRGDVGTLGEGRGVRSVQRDLAACNLWDGLFDGVYSVELHAVWDGVLKMAFLSPLAV